MLQKNLHRYRDSHRSTYLITGVRCGQKEGWGVAKLGVIRGQEVCGVAKIRIRRGKKVRTPDCCSAVPTSKPCLAPPKIDVAIDGHPICRASPKFVRRPLNNIYLIKAPSSLDGGRNWWKKMRENVMKKRERRKRKGDRRNGKQKGKWKAKG